MLAPVSPRTPARKNARVSARTRAFHADLTRLRGDLFGKALRMARHPDVAEDLVQDTVERALRFESKFEPGTNLRAWVHQILYNVFISRCRRGRLERAAMGLLTTDPCAWTRQETKPMLEQLSPPVARAMGELPAGFRLVVELVDIEEMSYRAASEKLDVPIGTVMSRLHRGRKQLAEGLREANRPRAAA